jgi:predicted acylesterase/phospholipase RssA
VPSTETKLPVGLCLPGGGAPGAMFQIAAIAALEQCIEGFEGGACEIYVGTSSGANLAAALAAGTETQRIYRAFLDPADDFFPLERKHILRMDLAQWGKTIEALVRTIGHGSKSILSRPVPAAPQVLWEELSRFYDSVPAGLFSLDAYERFLEETFVRRNVPLHFTGLRRCLRIIAHDLDTGNAVLFGAPGTEHVPIARACVASMATPPLFAPVRIGERHYFNPEPSHVSHVDVAVELGAKIVILVNPMVPVRFDGSSSDTAARSREGHTSLRDKGAMRVANQAHRIKLHGLLQASVARAREQGVKVIVIEPEAADATLLLHNPPGFAARRTVLEHSFRYTCNLVTRWIQDGNLPLTEAGWRARSSGS